MADRETPRRAAERQRRQERRLTIREAARQQHRSPGLDLRRPWWGGVEA